MSECPDPEFRKEIKAKLDICFNCLQKKISWTMMGVVVAAFSVVAMLSYSAYSSSQEKQAESIKENSRAVQELTSTTRVIENNLDLIKEQIKDAKDIQKISFDAIMRELSKIKRKGDSGE